MPEYTVTRLSVAPIKGLRLNHPADIQLDQTGAVGDRDFMVLNADNKVISITRCGPLVRMTAGWDPACGQLTITADDGASCQDEILLGEQVVGEYWGTRRRGRLVIGPWNALISRIAGQGLRLVKCDDPGAGSDVHPVTLIGEGSIRALERESGLGPIDPRRFRMLIQFACPDEHVEDTWETSEVSAGTARLRIGRTVPRCAAVTRDPDCGERDQPVVRAIRDYRGVRPTGFGIGVPFGVYADVLEAGTLRVGDRLRVLTQADRAGKASSMVP
jgi:uncharacterized protein YcbX